MCGILGIFTSQPLSGQDQHLESTLALLHHRGPDDSGLETFTIASGQLTLGHTRLSIIDLSPGGHQPMQSVDNRYTIVFNGEIYNYRELRQELKSYGYSFRTDSDTEVLLAAWAQWNIQGLRRLTGMFAFAVFDRAEQTLTLVRDAFGIKPLFYQHNSNSLNFASEIPALLGLLPQKPELNLKRAHDYLLFGHYDNTADTFYEGIYHLLPGCWLRIELTNLRICEPQRWWWPSIEERTDLSFEDAAAQLREMFLNNVRLHLRSDVPVGAALSGGIDSSAVVCAMRHLEPHMPIHTFSFVARGSSVDEEKWVDIVNAHVGAIPHKVVIHPHELADDLYDLIRAQGEPFGSTSIYAQYRVFKSAREAGIIVTLDGQGADEMLAGYNGYSASYLRSLLDRKQYIDAIRFLWVWSQWPNRGIRLALSILGSVVIPQRLRHLIKQAIKHDSPSTCLDVYFLRKRGVSLGFSKPPVYTDESQGRRLVEQLRSALTGNGLVSLLRHGDRNSMRWSIESRVPFLTIDLAEFLLSLPESYLLSSQGETKCVFRAAMRGIVPDVILDRREKIGFQTPEQNWMRSQRLKVREWLSSAKDVPFLHANYSQQYVEEMLNGHRSYKPQAWYLLNFCRWI